MSIAGITQAIPNPAITQVPAISQTTAAPGFEVQLNGPAAASSAAAPVAPGQPTPAGEGGIFAALESSFKPVFQELACVQREIQALARDIRAGKVDPLSGETMVRYLELQNRAHDASMGVTLVSKTVEMGTQGVKTLFQTQA